MFQKISAIIFAIILVSQTTVISYGQKRYEIRKTSSLPTPNPVVRENSLHQTLARDFSEIGLKCVFDASVQDNLLDTGLGDLTPASRIDLLLQQNQLALAIVEDKTVLVFQETSLNRIRLEKMELRKYKLVYLQAENLQSILPDILPKERRFFHSLKDRNTLLVTASALDHLKIKALLDVLDHAPLTISLKMNFYEVSASKQQDFSIGLNSQNVASGNALAFLPFNQSELNNKNVRFIGQIEIPTLNGRTSSIKIGQRVPIKTSSYYPQTTTDLTSPSNLVGKVLQAVLPNNQRDDYSSFNYEDAALELIATPNLELDSKGEPQLSLAFEFKNLYPETERTNSPTFQNTELKTMQILTLNEPMVAATWSIDRTAKENRPSFIPFVPMPSKTSRSNRKTIMTITAKIGGNKDLTESLNSEQNLEQRLRTVFSVELLMQNASRPRRIVE